MKNRKEKFIEKNDDIVLKFCPHCGSDKVWRVQRSEMEIITNHLSNGKYAVRKYLCNACNKTVLLHNSGIQNEESEPIPYSENLLGFSACVNCGSDNLELNEVSWDEEDVYPDTVGKTAFRKLRCLDCNTEIIISKEDYDASSRSEL